MRNSLKTIIKAAILGAATTGQAAAEEPYSDVAYIDNSTIFVPISCIESALRETFVKKSETGVDIDININMESGLISTTNWIDGKPVSANVWLGAGEAVASLEIGVIDSMATMTAVDDGALELQPPSEVTARLFYYGTERVPNYPPQNGDSEKAVVEYIETIEAHMMACPAPAIS
jgi:hypothetical protein